jgi:hypothetical protein
VHGWSFGGQFPVLALCPSAVAAMRTGAVNVLVIDSQCAERIIRSLQA